MTPAEKMAKAKAKKQSPDKPPWGQRIAARRPSVHRTTIKAHREKLGLTLRDVADGAGLNNPVVLDAECGREVMLTTAKKLAKFFGVTIEELWPDTKGSGG